MGLYYRKLFANAKENTMFEASLKSFVTQLERDSKWYRTRIDMYLARHGKQWKWEEKLRAREKNLQVLTYNVISNLIDQKVALIAGIDEPADFTVSSESSQESSVNSQAMHFLNYSYAKSGGSRLYERGVDLCCTVGQDMQYFEPMFDEATREFYIKFSRIPFYRYHVLGNPRDEYFEDAGGLIISEDITMSEISRRLKLTPKQQQFLYENRFLLNEIQALATDQEKVGQFFSLFRSDAFKEFYYDDGIFSNVLGASAKEQEIARLAAISTVRVVTHIYRDALTKVYKVERSNDISDVLTKIANARTPQEVLDIPKPNWNYKEQLYFKEELEQKYKDDKGNVYTIGQFVDEDVQNGFAIKSEVEIYPVVVRKYYGKAYYEEYRYATEVFPFTPMNRNWNDDKYAVGDVDSIYDLQRVYNEMMTLIKGVQEEMRLGDRYIFSDEFQFSVGGQMGDQAAQYQALEELLSCDRRALFAQFPREGEGFVRLSAKPISDSFIQYVYAMPSQMMERMGLQPYLMGEGGVPRTAADANLRSGFGTAQIKSIAYNLQRAVAEHGRKALIYAQLESPFNLTIKTDETQTKFNEIVYDENLGRYILVNQLRFDRSPLRVAFRNSEYHKNFRTKQVILDLIRYLPQNSPITMLMAEMLIKLEEIKELDDVLAKSNNIQELESRLQQAMEQIQVMTKEMMKIRQENELLKVNLDTTKRIAIAREKVNRELNKLVSEIRSITQRLQLNAEKEAAVNLERIRNVAEKVIDIMNEEAESFMQSESAEKGQSKQEPKEKPKEEPTETMQVAPTETMASSAMASSAMSPPLPDVNLNAPPILPPEIEEMMPPTI